MSSNLTEKNEDSKTYIEELRLAYHHWRHEDLVTKILFKYLKVTADDLTSFIINNAFSNVSSDEKLMLYHLTCAKLQLINEILNLTADDLAEQIGEYNDE